MAILFKEPQVIAYFAVAGALWPFFILIAIKFWNSLGISIHDDFMAFCFGVHILVLMPMVFAACWMVVIPMAAVIGLLYIIWRAFFR